MVEGKPMMMVVGGTDTGRAPLVAGMLRHMLGNAVLIESAGVLAHAGEHAANEAQLALDQFGIKLGAHVARLFRTTNYRAADLLLAVDRGTEMVLFAELPEDPRIRCLPVLANTADVLDPHRMPLGVWISTARQLHDQINVALPLLRNDLRLPTSPATPVTIVAPAPQPPFAVSNGSSKHWDRDEDMQRLLGLISQPQVAPVVPKPTNGRTQPLPPLPGDEPIERPTPIRSIPAPPTPSTATATPATAGAPGGSAATRAELVARMCQLLDAATHAPEIIDWTRLQRTLIERLRVVAQQSTDTHDFVQAAALMVEGKLQQQNALPGAEALFLLRRAIHRLGETVDTINLGLIGTDLGQW